MWLDLPLDVQGATIDEPSLRGFDPGEDALSQAWRPARRSRRRRERTIDLLNAAERPVVLIGNGVRLGGRARRDARR